MNMPTYDFLSKKLKDFILSEISNETSMILIELISDDAFTDFRYVGNQYEIVKQIDSPNICITDFISKEHGVSEEQCRFYIDASELLEAIKSNVKFK